jgi:hypothetical protein
MSVELDRLPISEMIVTDTCVRAVTIEEADEGRRHAAEIGDYVMAQRWLVLERHIAAVEDRVVTAITHAREGETP